MFTEGSFVLIDGDYTLDSIFKVAEIGHPPSERRDEAMFVLRLLFFESILADLTNPLAGRSTAITTSLASAPCLRARRCARFQPHPCHAGLICLLRQADLILAEQSPSHETSFIILSDLHLDSPKVMSGLRQVLQVYDQMEEKEIPKLFVLCGNFRSRPWLFDGEAMREYTGESARSRCFVRRRASLRSRGRT